jgi:hypothetical protein
MVDCTWPRKILFTAIDWTQNPFDKKLFLVGDISPMILFDCLIDPGTKLRGL